MSHRPPRDSGYYRERPPYRSADPYFNGPPDDYREPPSGRYDARPPVGGRGPPYSRDYPPNDRPRPVNRLDVNERLALERPSRSLFVRNINNQTDTEHLKDIFQKYGDIRDVFRTINRGIAFIHYYDLRAAEQAKKELQEYELAGRKLDVHFSLPKEVTTGDHEWSKHEPATTVFVTARNLNKDVTTNDYLEYFSTFGDIKEIRDGKNKGTQKFIEYFDSRHASIALEKAANARFHGGTIAIDVARAVVKPEDRHKPHRNPYVDDRYSSPASSYDAPPPAEYGLDYRRDEAERERAYARSRDRESRYDDPRAIRSSHGGYDRYQPYDYSPPRDHAYVPPPPQPPLSSASASAYNAPPISSAYPAPQGYGSSSIPDYPPASAIPLSASASQGYRSQQGPVGYNDVAPPSRNYAPVPYDDYPPPRSQQVAADYPLAPRSSLSYAGNADPLPSSAYAPVKSAAALDYPPPQATRGAGYASTPQEYPSSRQDYRSSSSSSDYPAAQPKQGYSTQDYSRQSGYQPLYSNTDYPPASYGQQPPPTSTVASTGASTSYAASNYNDGATAAGPSSAHEPYAPQQGYAPSQAYRTASYSSADSYRQPTSTASQAQGNSGSNSASQPVNMDTMKQLASLLQRQQQPPASSSYYQN